MRGAFLGRPGERPIPVHCPAPTMGIVAERTARVLTTLSSRRIGQQPPGTGGREWSVDLSTLTPEQLTPWQEFLDGAWGPGPFVWTDPWAPATNLVSPHSATLAHSISVTSELVDGPEMLPTGAILPRYFHRDSGSWNLFPIVGDVLEPAMAVTGQPLTASIWARGAVDKVELEIVATGSKQRTVAMTRTTGGTLEWHHYLWTGGPVAPFSAGDHAFGARMRVTFNSTSAPLDVARPLVTWQHLPVSGTPPNTVGWPHRWASGAGAPSVMLSPGTLSPDLTSPAYATMSVNITEVGVL